MRIHSAEFIRSAVSDRDFLRDGRPEIAFVGRSNVGKSSLLNRLLGRRKLARTSSTPGRTRAVNYFLVDGAIYFVDLPGYGWAKASRDDRDAWGRLVERYFAERPARVVLLVDAKVGATPLDVEAHEFLRAAGSELMLVATKYDRVKAAQRALSLADIRATLGLADAAEVIPVSARTGEGVPALWSRILEVESNENERGTSP